MKLAVAFRATQLLGNPFAALYSFVAYSVGSGLQSILESIDA
jgi:hypothetical protein